MTIVRLVTLLLILQSGGCVETDAIAEGYRVVAYDGRSHEYTIHRNGTFDGKYLVKKIVAVCETYKVGDAAPVAYDTACQLPVGNMYPFWRRSDAPGGFVNVLATNEWLSIAEGDGPDRTLQHLRVLSVELLPDSHCQ